MRNTLNSRRLVPMPALVALALAGLLAPMVNSFGQTSSLPNRIAFIRDADIWVMDGNGNNQQQLTFTRTCRLPTWSPERTRIAYVSTEGGQTDLWILTINYEQVNGAYTGRINGVTKSRLTNDTWGENDPEWGPAGVNADKIAFSSDRTGNWQLYTIAIGDEEPTQLTFDPWGHRGPTWSPDGRTLAFMSPGPGGARTDIWMMSAIPGAADWRVWAGSMGVFNLSWSPSLPGEPSRIAFMYRDGHDIWVLDLDASYNPGRVTQLTTNRKDDSYPTWSPDGTQIAFQTDRPGTDIYRMDAVDLNQDKNGDNLKALAVSSKTEGMPAWH